MKFIQTQELLGLDLDISESTAFVQLLVETEISKETVYFTINCEYIHNEWEYEIATVETEDSDECLKELTSFEEDDLAIEHAKKYCENLDVDSENCHRDDWDSIGIRTFI